MPSVRDHPLLPPFDQKLSLVQFAGNQGLQKPFSVRQLLNHVDTRQFHATITTAGLEALGGTVDLTIRSDGSYAIHVHLHDSGFTSYSFRVLVVLTSLGSSALMFECSGAVEGTDKTVPFVHEPNRNFDWSDSGSRPILLRQWQAFAGGEMHVSKAYEYAGLVGTLAEIEHEWLTFLFGTAVLGLPPVAVIAFVSTTFGRLTGARFLGPGGLVGLIAAGGTYYLFGAGMVLPVFVGGALAGELLLPRHRHLEADEIEFARQVFGNTIPYERVILTDMVGLGGRPFTFPGIDGSILVNIGVENAYDQPTTYARTTCCPNAPGKPGHLFIHEMTHAWQIANGTLEAFLCDAALATKVGEVTQGQNKVYSYGSPEGAWDDFNMEQQASLVEEWFAGLECKGPNPPNCGRTPLNVQDPYFRYIAGNIRIGQT